MPTHNLKLLLPLSVDSGGHPLVFTRSGQPWAGLPLCLQLVCLPSHLGSPVEGTDHTRLRSQEWPAEGATCTDDCGLGGPTVVSHMGPGVGEPGAGWDTCRSSG